MSEDTTRPLDNVIRIDDERIQDHLGKIVGGSVEETLNALLDAEADRLCNAERYERSEARQDTRAGSYERKLHTTAGEVSLKVPKLRRQTFETAIIERYRRRECSVEEALVEMYLAGVSVRRVEDITEALWGTRVSSGTVSNLNKKIYEQIEAWRNKPIEGVRLCLPRRYRTQAELGGRGAQRLAAGGDRGEPGGFPRDPRHRGRRQGGQSRLERLSGPSQGTRPLRRRVDRLGCLSGSGGERVGLLPRGPLAALRGALLAQRLQPCARDQGARGRPHAESHSCPGEPRGGCEEGREGRRRTEGPKALQGGRTG